MPASRPGRHRAQARPAAGTLLRGTALLAASGGMVASLSLGAAAAPGGAPTPATRQHTPAAAVPPAATPAGPGVAATALPGTSPLASPAVSTTVQVPTATISGTVRWGSRGSDVRKVQRVVGTQVDGVFGPVTHAAVKRWQRRHGLVADGIVGPVTTRAMGLDGRSRSSASRGGSSAASSAGSVSGTLRWGSRGSGVRTVQRVVGTQVDGVFGPMTHAAVKRWQRRHGLVADGIVGPLTTQAMGLTSRSQTSASRSSSSRSAVLAAAARHTGVWYSYGGSSPSTGFDCSGYTQYVFSQVGVSLPRTAEQQRQRATPVSQPRPGDLVFWGAPAWHVAIYAGDGMVYDAGRSGLSSQKRAVFSGVTGYGRVG